MFAMPRPVPNSLPVLTTLACAFLLALPACKVPRMKRPPVRGEGMEFLAEDLRPEVLHTHLNEFTVIFTGVVEKAADEIAEEADDPDVLRNALRWKIQAVPEAQLAGLRLAPVAGIMDLWTFSVQMHLFFAVGAGREVFGEQQELAVRASQRLRDEMADVARHAVDPEQFEATEQRITDWAEDHPLESLTFARDSIIPDFAEASRRSEDVFGSMGTIEDVAVAGEASLAILAASLPRQARWQAELVLHEMLRGEEGRTLLLAAEEASELMGEVPELVETSINALRDTARSERETVMIEADALAAHTVKEFEHLLMRAIDRLVLRLLLILLAGLVLLPFALRIGRRIAFGPQR